MFLRPEDDLRHVELISDVRGGWVEGHPKAEDVRRVEGRGGAEAEGGDEGELEFSTDDGEELGATRLDELFEGVGEEAGFAAGAAGGTGFDAGGFVGGPVEELPGETLVRGVR